MKSKIFSPDFNEIQPVKKKVYNVPSEVGGIITYKGYTLPEESHAQKPTNNKIRNQDANQKRTLTGLAKVYSQRTVSSQVTLNSY
jgi:hypothetical protein